MKIQNAESFGGWLDWLAGRKIGARESKGQYFINLVNESGLDFSKSSEDFVGVDLSDIDLTEASLAGANFRKSDLKRSILVHTDLRNADLRDVELQNADLSYADLSGADLSGANLQGAILNHTNLTDTHPADPTDVYLGNSQFENVTWSEQWNRAWQRDNPDTSHSVVVSPTPEPVPPATPDTGTSLPNGNYPWTQPQGEQNWEYWGDQQEHEGL